MRCVATTKADKRCRWPSDRLAGGLAVCEYHVRWAEREFEILKQSIGPDHPVIRAAERDTYERNRLYQVKEG